MVDVEEEGEGEAREIVRSDQRRGRVKTSVRSVRGGVVGMDLRRAVFCDGEMMESLVEDPSSWLISTGSVNRISVNRGWFRF